MTTKHTPGPWKRSKRNPFEIYHPGNGMTIALVKSSHGAHGKDGRALLAESGANADLIEAAPDLLAFARRVMADHRAQLPSEARDLYGGGCGCPQCEQARAAIAKAEGRA